MNIYEKILAIRKELPPFQFDRTAGDVKIISDEQMNKALVPLLDKYNIITIPHGEIIGDHFKLTVEFRSLPMEGIPAHKDEEDRMEAHMSWPIDKRNFEFGATATLADKYLSVILFKIKADVKIDNQVRKDAFKFQLPHDEHEKLIESLQTGDITFLEYLKLLSGEVPEGWKGQVPTLGVGVGENIVSDTTILNPNTPSTFTSEEKKEEVTFPDGTPNIIKTEEKKDELQSLLDQVSKDENLTHLEVVEKAEKKEPEPSVALQTRINEGDWKLEIPLHKCTDEITATRALDSMYMNLGTGIYGHVDNERCPVNPYKVIDQMARRSNLKIRRAIVQFRIFGEEAFWNQLEAETSLKKEEILAKLASPKTEVVKEETKPIIHKLKLDFEISEHMGVDRDEEETFKLLQNLLRIGITKFTIIYALGKMKEKPEIVSKDDDGIIMEFLSKGSLLQIEEMVKLAKGAG